MNAIDDPVTTTVASAHRKDRENRPDVPVPASFSRRHFLIGAALAGATVLSQARMPKPVYPRIPKGQFESWVPKKVGPWTFATESGVVLPTPDALADRLYDDLLTRVYQSADGRTVMVAMAYNNVQNGVLQLHRPEICYPAGGFQLSPTTTIAIPTSARTIAASTFTAKSFERTEQVVYWTRVGTRFPRTWAEQRLAVMAANLERQIPDGMLARFSVIDPDADSAFRTLREFITNFETVCAEPMRRLLVGTPSSRS